MLYFITGNKGKFEEVRAILPEIEQLDIDLPEIQEIDAHAVVRAKLEAAYAHHDGQFIVEDLSLYLECLNGLPGPLIKWFLKTIGNEGLVQIAEKFDNDRATAKTLIGYARSKDDVQFFEGVIEGRIVPARGVRSEYLELRKTLPDIFSSEAKKSIGKVYSSCKEGGFGWDPIFLPDGHDKTFGEMTQEEENVISMRRIATDKLKAFLAR